MPAIGYRLSVIGYDREGRAQVVPVETGLPFLGWHVYPYRLRLKRRNVLAFARRYRRMRARYAAGRCTLDEIKTRIQGWLGHARQGHTLALRRSLLRKLLPKQRRAVQPRLPLPPQRKREPGGEGQ